MHISQDKEYIRFDNEKEVGEYFSKDGWSKDKKSWFPYCLSLENMSFPLFLQRESSPDVLATVGNVYHPMKESQLESLKQEYNELQKLFNEPSAVTELEKLKAEINEKDRAWIPKSFVNKVFDKRIAELKGE